MLRILIATTIISLGISGAAYFVLHESQVLVPTLDTTSPAKSVQNKPLVESWSPTKQTQNEPKLEESDGDNSQNLTDELIQNLARNIIQQNPSGPEQIEGELWLNADTPEKIINQLLTEAVQKFDPESLKPIINENELKITDDNSEIALINYLIGLGKITLNSSKNIPAEIFDPASLSIEVLNQTIKVYQETIEKIYNLPVPRLALEIHKKEIQLLSAVEGSFKSIKNYEMDAITAIMAAKNLSELNYQFNDLKNEISEFIKNNNINI